MSRNTYKRSIFWFRQDLRIYDNRGLIKALENSDAVLPIFILDKNLIPEFLGLSDKKFGFLREMLENLNGEIVRKGGEKLHVLNGYPEEIVPDLVQKYNIEAVYSNRSYGTYGMSRDKTIKEKLEKSLGINFLQEKDFLLQEPWEVDQRKVFTPYFKLWQKQTFDTEEMQYNGNIKTVDCNEGIDIHSLIPLEKHPFFTLEFGKKRLAQNISNLYSEYRNALDLDGTSKLSPYMRHGVFSIRQIYNIAQDKDQHFVSELAWREFWNQIFYNFPETKNKPFQEKKQYIKWENNMEKFEKWCKGETGYPIVDAAMKQLVETNWMHGRARMIVASFLTKDLLIDWEYCEAFFKKHLLDYDEAVNIGNWQWSASVGADPKPLRIFSPILQSQRFDPKATFIRKYLPELELEEIKAIHDPLKYSLHYRDLIVDHSVAQREAKEVYKQSAIIHTQL